MASERNRAEVQGFDFQGRKVVILGLARQGLALARFFVQAGAQTIVSDAAPAEKLTQEIAQLGELPVALVLGGHPDTLLDDCDLLCLSGGVPPQSDFVQAAIARGIPLSNDSLLTLQVARQRGLGPLVALTGSSGKTTTTTLVGLMLAASGKQVHVGGNIGTPLIDRLDEIQPGEPIVLELSSFQLELFDPKLAWGDLNGSGPDVAAILNITPNHLDRHPDMAAYADAKFNLLRRAPAGAQLVVSADDPVMQRLAPADAAIQPQALPTSWRLEDLLSTVRTGIAQNGNPTIAFSRVQALPEGAWLAGDQLLYQGQEICERQAVLLRGEHNISNLLAAAAISGAAGATIDGMHQVATTFQGVRHRLEIVSSDACVTWINDSIATAPERAVAALRCFNPGEQTLILLAGGKDKNLPWEQFADEVLARVNYLIGFGHAGAMIVDKVHERAQYTKRRAPNCAVVQRLDEAVALAARVAGLTNTPPANAMLASSNRASDAPNNLSGNGSSSSGNTNTNGNGNYGQQRDLCPTVVLLSPGGTSYDAYRNFEERGEHFRRLVNTWNMTQGQAAPLSVAGAA